MFKLDPPLGAILPAMQGICAKAAAHWRLAQLCCARKVNFRLLGLQAKTCYLADTSKVRRVFDNLSF
jgi:hypothetical protein